MPAGRPKGVLRTTTHVVHAEVTEGAEAVAPVIPASADKLLALIDAGKGGAPISQPQPLFPRLELSEDEEAA